MTFHKEVTFDGWHQPILVVLKAVKALNDMEAGQVLRLVLHTPDTSTEIEKACTQKGIASVLSGATDEDGHRVLLLQKI